MSQFSEKGIIDLRSWDFEKDGVVSLDGGWEFFWNKLLTPDDFKNNKNNPDFYTNSLKTWNNFKLNGKRLSPIGYGTYRVKILLPGEKNNSKLVLKIASVYSSYICWFNDKLVIRKGNPSVSAVDFKGSNYPELLYLDAENRELLITMNVSNYFFSMSGGISESIYLGTPKDILSLTEKNIFFYIMSFGIFLIMFVYHFWLWILRKKDLYNLYFSIICLLMALQSLFISERSIYYIFKELDIRIFFQLWYLVFFMFPLSLLFFREFFPAEINKYLVYLSLFIYGFCILLNFTLPSILFTAIAPYFYYTGIFFIFYIIYSNIRAIINKREFAVLFFIGSLIPAAAALNDSLFSMNAIKTAFVTPFGFIIYLAMQSYLLAFKFTRSFKQVEVLTCELDHLNKNLEKKIDERTHSLQIAISDVKEKNLKISRQNRKLGSMHIELSKVNLQLQSLATLDHLTGLANRRLFFDFYKYEWNRSLRNKEPISIIFIDVDYFKQYNDTYGHITGDKTLKKVASVFAKIARRAADIAARFGGEEFIIVLSNTDLKGALVVAERIRKEVESLKIKHKSSATSLHITVSIGVSSVIPDKNMDSNMFITAADNALYKAKETGRNKVEYILMNK